MVARELVCLYGSVTGKAESIAEQVVERAAELGHAASLHSLGEVGKAWRLEETSTAVIVSSTTGDGEQPENVTKFWRKLRSKTLPADHLAHLQYALLGLGDTNYNQFCAAPRALHRRLQELGARALVPPGWADDGTGLEVVVEPWLEQLWPALGGGVTDGVTETAGMEGAEGKGDGGPVGGEVKAEVEEDMAGLSLAPSPPVTLPPCPAPYILVTYPEDTPPPPPALLPLPPLPSAAGPLLPATLSSCRRLTSPLAVKHYYEAVLEVEGVEYQAGDTVAIVCPNPEEEVAALGARLGMAAVWRAACSLSILPGTTKKRAVLAAWLPTETTLHTLFTHHLDLRAVPKKTLVRALVEHTAEPGERGELARLCSKEGAAEYLARVREAQLSLMDLLAMAPSCRPPVTILLEHLPRLLPRPYSLSSSPLTSPHRLSFVFTQVTSPRPGLATTWLATSPPTVPLYLRTNTSFVPPSSPSEGYIMVGAGSGLGPFLAFLEDRQARGAGGAAPCWLFYGCRSRKADYIYRETLATMVEEGVLDKLVVAFSREEGELRYVQDGLRRHGEEVVRLVEEGARVYVCGDARGMARGVQEVLEQLLVELRGLEQAEAVQFVKQLREKKQYLEDIWT